MLRYVWAVPTRGLTCQNGIKFVVVAECGVSSPIAYSLVSLNGLCEVLGIS